LFFGSQVATSMLFGEQWIQDDSRRRSFSVMLLFFHFGQFWMVQLYRQSTEVVVSPWPFGHPPSQGVMGRVMRRSTLKWLLIGSLAATVAPSISNADYLLTTIAHSDQTSLGGFTLTIDSISAGATLNESGQVLFMALTQPVIAPPCRSISNVVAVGDGTTVTALTDPGSTFHAFGFPVGLNEAGQTSFLGQHLTELVPGSCEIGPSGVYRGDPVAITKIADESIFDGIVSGAFSQLDASGAVAFMSRGAVRNGIYQGDGTESVFGDYAVIEENTSGTGTPIYRDAVAANPSGQVAYLVEESVGYGIRISRSGPSGMATIAQSGDTIAGVPGSILVLRPPAMNDSGSVAFVASLTEPNAQAVLIGDGVSTRLVHLNTVPSTILLAPVVSINNLEEVLIGGQFDGKEALFVVRDQTLEKVVEAGDALLGSVIDQLGLVSPALNDAGQVAFYAKLATGLEVVVRADPIAAPEVPSLSWLPIGGLAVILATLGALRLARAH
jgi:hypothetical protein